MGKSNSPDKVSPTGVPTVGTPPQNPPQGAMVSPVPLRGTGDNTLRGHRRFLAKKYLAARIRAKHKDFIA